MVEEVEVQAGLVLLSWLLPGPEDEVAVWRAQTLSIKAPSKTFLMGELLFNI